MTTYSSIRAWEIPQAEESGGLQSMGSQRVRHDLATKQQQMYYESEGQRRDILKDFMLGEQEGRVMHVSKIQGQSSSGDGVFLYQDGEASFREKIISVKVLLRCLWISIHENGNLKFKEKSKIEISVWELETYSWHSNP